MAERTTTIPQNVFLFQWTTNQNPMNIGSTTTKKRDAFGVLEDFFGDALEGSVGFTLIFVPRLLRLPRLRNGLGNGRRNPKPIPKR